MPVRIKRVYDKPEAGDGVRILVDRLWPRGLSKEKACVDLWAKDVSPTSELRKWFAHKPDRWEQFQRSYRNELAENPAFDDLCERADKETMTLLYAARDETHSHAVVLASLMTERNDQLHDAFKSDDTGVPMEVSSPPCLMHELDPDWLGVAENHHAPGAPSSEDGNNARKKPYEKAASGGRK